MQESRAVAEKPHDAVVKFNTCRNLQRHRAVVLAIARLSCHKVFSALVTLRCMSVDCPPYGSVK